MCKLIFISVLETGEVMNIFTTKTSEIMLFVTSDRSPMYLADVYLEDT